MHLKAGISWHRTGACIESNDVTARVATVPDRLAYATLLLALKVAKRATESINMEGSNGTNLKPIAPILFF